MIWFRVLYNNKWTILVLLIIITFLILAIKVGPWFAMPALILGFLLEDIREVSDDDEFDVDDD